MLCLSRKVGDQINIGDDIVIHVRRIAGNRCSIGIEAPPQKRILRSELSPHEIQTAQELAASRKEGASL